MRTKKDMDNEKIGLNFPADIIVTNPLKITYKLHIELLNTCENYSRYLFSLNVMDGRTMSAVRLAMTMTKIKLNEKSFKTSDELSASFYYIMAIMDSYLTGLGYRYYPDIDTGILNYHLNSEDEEDEH